MQPSATAGNPVIPGFGPPLAAPRARVVRTQQALHGLVESMDRLVRIMLPVAKALHRGYPTPLGRALSRLHHLCSQGRQRQLGRRVDPKGGLGNAAFHMVPFERSGGFTCRGKFSLPLRAPVVRSRRHTRLSLIAQEPTVADRPVGSRQQVLAHLLSTHSHGFGSHVEMKRLRPTLDGARSEWSARLHDQLELEELEARGGRNPG